MSLSEEKSHLFDMFKPTSASDWQAQILRDLKAATAEEKKMLYEQRMIWHTYEAIPIQPFYTVEDIPPQAILFPEKNHASWQNQETIKFITEKETNELAIEAIRSGAQAIAFDLTGTPSTSVHFSKLLQHIKPSETPVGFITDSVEKDFILNLKNIFPYHWKGSLHYDPIAYYLTHGKPILPENYDILVEIVRQTTAFPEFYAITVGSHSVHEAGASAVQELALLIASFVAYADQLTNRGIAVNEIFKTTQFSISVSTNYFMEIAKCRALRLLFARLAETFGANANPVFIHAQTALWNKSPADAYNNMIRATIEAMAAVAGGCDALTVAPYNAAFDKSNAFARRIARNISTILKEESYFDKVLNIASGAYYIEYLTNELAREAWKLFQVIETKGGIIPAFNSGFVNNIIEEMRLQKEADLKSGKQILVGVNKYQVPDEAIEQKEYFKKLFQNRDSVD